MNIAVALTTLLVRFTVGASDCGSGGECQNVKPGDSLVQSKVQLTESATNPDGESAFDTIEHKLQEFAQEYENCLAEIRSEAKASGDPLIPRHVDELVRFESGQKLLASGVELDDGHKYLAEPQIWALISDTADEAAQILVSRKMIAALRSTVEQDVSAAAAERFAQVLENTARACGRSVDEATALRHAEEALLKTASGGSLDDITKDVAVTLAEDLWEQCKAEAMDVDFFVEHDDLFTGGGHCSQHVNRAILQHSAKIKQHLNYHMKHVLIVHNSSNGIGHKIAQHWRTHGVDKSWWGPDAPDPDLHEAFVRTVASPLSALQQQQIKYLEDKDMSAVINLNRAEFCATRPMDSVLSYWKCLCEQANTELACRAQNVAGLTQAAEAVMTTLEEAKRMANAKRDASAANASAVWFGPCKSPLECEITMGGETFSVPDGRRRRRGKSRRRSLVQVSGESTVDSEEQVFGETAVELRPAPPGQKFKADDVFQQIEERMKDMSRACDMHGSCSFSIGSPPKVCNAYLQFTAGFDTPGCRDHGYKWFSQFKIYLEADFCLGGDGIYAKLLDLFDRRCFPVGDVTYWPLVGKVRVRVAIHPLPPLVEGWIEFNFPVAQHTPKAVIDWLKDWSENCCGPHGSYNFKNGKRFLNDFRGAFEMHLSAEANTVFWGKHKFVDVQLAP